MTKMITWIPMFQELRLSAIKVQLRSELYQFPKLFPSARALSKFLFNTHQCNHSETKLYNLLHTSSSLVATTHVHTKSIEALLKSWKLQSPVKSATFNCLPLTLLQQCGVICFYLAKHNSCFEGVPNKNPFFTLPLMRYSVSW